MELVLREPPTCTLVERSFFLIQETNVRVRVIFIWRKGSGRSLFCLQKPRGLNRLARKGHRLLDNSIPISLRAFATLSCGSVFDGQREYPRSDVVSLLCVVRQLVYGRLLSPFSHFPRKRLKDQRLSGILTIWIMIRTTSEPLAVVSRFKWPIRPGEDWRLYNLLQQGFFSSSRI